MATPILNDNTIEDNQTMRKLRTIIYALVGMATSLVIMVCLIAY